MPITIMLADDHPVVRLGLRSLLEKEQDFTIIGEAFDGIETVRLVEKLQPDILILDLMMPGMNGFSVTAEVKRRAYRTRIIILSMHASDAYVQEAFMRGAMGYVLKDTAANEIIKAIRTVTAGSRYLGQLVEEHEIDVYAKHFPGRLSDPYDTLTERERELLHLVAQGLQNKEIAEQLAISVRTVETHRAHIMSKLNLKNHAELIHFAVQKKIILLP